MATIQVSIDKLSMSRSRWKRPLETHVVEALSKSIESEGQLHAITVRKNGRSYEVLAGQHRLKACKKLGLKKIEATVVEVDDADAEMIGIQENYARSTMNSSERCRAIVRAKELYEAKYGKPKRGRPAATSRAPKSSRKKKRKPELGDFEGEMSARTGKSARTIRQDVLRAERLAPKVRKAWSDGQINDTQADELVKLDADKQLELLDDLKGAGRTETRAAVRAAKTTDKQLNRLARLLRESAPLAGKLNMKLGQVLALAEAQSVTGIGGGVRTLKLAVEIRTLHDTLDALEKRFGK